MASTLFSIDNCQREKLFEYVLVQTVKNWQKYKKLKPDLTMEKIWDSFTSK